MEERFDQMFIMIAQEAGGIQPLFDAFFSFLKRRTDFYVLANPGDPVGFPPGVAEKIVYAAYMKYREEYNKQHPFTPKPVPSQPSTQEEVKQPPQVLQSDKPKTTEQASMIEKPDIPKPAEKAEVAPKVPNPDKVEISTSNGAKTDKYNWNQDINDVTVQIKLPPGTKSRDLDVRFEPKRISVALKSDKSNPLLSGELFDKIHADNSYWSLDEGTIIISLEKAKENVWKSVILGDSEIDTQKVDTSRRVDEYDEETAAGIRKVMYEQARKMQGLPTSDEEAAMKALQEAWNKEDSPFKGQPFDVNRMMSKPEIEELQEDILK